MPSTHPAPGEETLGFSPSDPREPLIWTCLPRILSAGFRQLSSIMTTVHRGFPAFELTIVVAIIGISAAVPE